MQIVLNGSKNFMKDISKNKPSFDFELSLKKQGYKYIIGVDEFKVKEYD